MTNITVCYDEKNVEIVTVDRVVNIDHNLAGIIKYFLLQKNVFLTSYVLTIDSIIEWNSNNSLTLVSKTDILLATDTKIISKGRGSIFLKAGIKNTEDKGSVIFKNENEKQIHIEGEGKVYIYYNPIGKNDNNHKYYNPYGYFKHVQPEVSVTSYMLVNNIKDLQDINRFLHGNYAISRDINAYDTKNWNNGKGFQPLTSNDKHIPFSGNFDGNDFTIRGLFINRTNEKDVGLFGIVAGQKKSPATVSNLKLQDLYIKGDMFVGGVAGDSEFASFSNINVLSEEIFGRDVVGGLLGTGKNVVVNNILIDMDIYDSIHTSKYKGLIFGSGQNIQIYNASNICVEEISELGCIGYSKNVEYL
jgi:hypothetical protein